MKKWKYEDEMSFVAPFFLERKTLDSVELTSDDEDPDNDHETGEIDPNTLETPIENEVNDTAAIHVTDSNTIVTVTQTEVENAVQNTNSDHYQRSKEG